MTMRRGLQCVYDGATGIDSHICINSLVGDDTSFDNTVGVMWSDTHGRVLNVSGR
jgi:hypothetical protein